LRDGVEPLVGERRGGWVVNHALAALLDLVHSLVDALQFVLELVHDNSLSRSLLNLVRFKIFR